MRKVTILSWSGIYYPYSQEDIIKSLEDQLEQSRKLHPDLICFPEEALYIKGDHANPNWAENNLRALKMMARWAKELHSYIAVSLEEPSRKYPGRSYNTTYMIDREGRIISKYRKLYITFRAIGGRGLRGEKPVVCDTDFGRVGFVTCFDANWRHAWQELKDMGAELVFFTSAYDAGSLLHGYAAVHMYHVVSSVSGGGPMECRIIDPLGTEIAASTNVDGLAAATIDLDTEYFHTDHNGIKVSQLRKDLGDKVHIMTNGRYNIFSLTSKDPQWPMERIIKEYGLLTYKKYIEQSTADNLAHSLEYPEEEMFFEDI